MRIQVARFDPQEDAQPQLEEFEIAVAENETVLGALQYIYEHKDSSLGFRYGCRFKGCGLCTIKINGRARPACTTKVKDGMVLEPMDHFPVLRDLCVDRRPITDFFAHHKLYLVPPKEKKIMIHFKVPGVYDQLVSCTECLACLSECSSFQIDNKKFGGPLTFVKLAQLHHDPRDTLDRRSQAKDLGISACIDCKTKCRCPNGIPIFRLAIKPFLE